MHPADEFVEEFVGADRALKRLALAARRPTPSSSPPADARGPDRSPPATSLRDALAALLQDRDERLPVADATAACSGRLTLEAIHAELRRRGAARPRLADARAGRDPRPHRRVCVADNGFCPEWIADNFDRYGTRSGSTSS